MQAVTGQHFGVDGGAGARNDSSHAERPENVRWDSRGVMYWVIRWVIRLVTCGIIR
jgi:hypothetical protein